MGSREEKGQDQMQREGPAERRWGGGAARAGDAQMEGQEGLKEDKWGLKPPLEL